MGAVSFAGWVALAGSSVAGVTITAGVGGATPALSAAWEEGIFG